MYAEMNTELAKELTTSKLDPKIYKCAIEMSNYIDDECFRAIYIEKKNYKKVFNPCLERLNAIQGKGKKKFSCELKNLFLITTKFCDLLKRKGYVVDDSGLDKLRLFAEDAEEHNKTVKKYIEDYPDMVSVINANSFTDDDNMNILIKMEVY
jgi:hypothetical protein